QEVVTDADLTYETSSASTYVIGGGISAHITPNRSLDASLYCDWNMVGATALSSDRLHSLSVGLSTAIRF
ncbi:MAG: hypothetical protein HUK03_07410, partial [Bacteroidaceae bacterium]|nr:hypothetical protein [Bacteroidaceae bacterium]